MPPSGDEDIGEADTALDSRERQALSSVGYVRKEVSDSDRVDGTLFPGQIDCTVSGGFSRLRLCNLFVVAESRLEIFDAYKEVGEGFALAIDEVDEEVVVVAFPCLAAMLRRIELDTVAIVLVVVGIANVIELAAVFDYFGI